MPQNCPRQARHPQTLPVAHMGRVLPVTVLRGQVASQGRSLFVAALSCSLHTKDQQENMLLFRAQTHQRTTSMRAKSEAPKNLSGVHLKVTLWLDCVGTLVSKLEGLARKSFRPKPVKTCKCLVGFLNLGPLCWQELHILSHSFCSLCAWISPNQSRFSSRPIRRSESIPL